jgi:hypothetical protein
MDAPYAVVFITDETLGINSLVETALDLGFTLNSDSESDTVYQYDIDGQRQSGADRKSVVESIDVVENGSIYLWGTGDWRLRLSVYSPNNEFEEWFGRVNVGFQTNVIDRAPHPDRTVRQRVESIVSLVIELMEVVHPDYVWSAIFDENERYESVRPDGWPIADHVTDLSWITGMSPSVVDQFGGREHVRNTPAWRIEALDSGHIVLVLRDHPYDPTEAGTPQDSWRRHLI